MSNATTNIYNTVDVEAFKEAYNEAREAFVAEKLDAQAEDLYAVLIDSIGRDQGADAVRDLIRRNIKNAVESFIPVGIPVPEFSIRHFVNILPQDAYSLTVQLVSNKNTLVSTLNVSEKNTLTAENGKEVYIRIFNFMANVYEAMVVATMASINLSLVNSIYAEATGPDFADKHFTIEFIPKSAAKHSQHIVDSISNDHVTFVVPDEVALDVVPKFAVFQGISELPNKEDVAQEDFHAYYLLDETNKLAERQFQRIVDEISDSQTVVDFIRNHSDYLKQLTELRSHKISTLITKAFSRKITGVNANPSSSQIALVAEDGILGAVQYIPAHTVKNGDGVEEEVPGEWVEYLAAVTRDGAEPASVDVVEVAKKVLASR